MDGGYLQWRQVLRRRVIACYGESHRDGIFVSFMQKQINRRTRM